MSKKNGAAAKEAKAERKAELDENLDANLAGIVLSEEARAKLSSLEMEAVRAKVALADLDLQFARIEAARVEHREAVQKAQKAYVDQVVASAGEHGIDLNDKTVRWNFDTSKMTFTRTH